MSKVPVQKGQINPSTKTSKSMSREEKVRERDEEGRMYKDGMTMKLKIPKK